MISDRLGTNFHMDLGIFGTQTCRSACLVTSLWRPGAILGCWGAQEMTLGRPGLDFCLFFAEFREPILKAFWVPWTRKGLEIG